MRRIVLCLSLLAFSGCSDPTPAPVPQAAPTVTTESLKKLLTEIEKSGTAGSGMQQIQIGVDASGKEDLKKDMEALSKADSAGQKAKVKELAGKMLKSL